MNSYRRHEIAPDVTAARDGLEWLDRPAPRVDDEHPVALLMAHGVAAFFDERGRQLAELQRDGWAGLHAFRRRFPGGRVEVLSRGLPLRDADVERLLRQLVRPRPWRRRLS